MIIYQFDRVRERNYLLAYVTSMVRGNVLVGYLYICFRVCQSGCKFTCIQSWVISCSATLCLFGSLHESRVLGNAPARASDGAYHHECLALMHTCSDAADVCPNAALVHSCYTVGSPVHVEWCPDAITQVPPYRVVHDMTFVRI
jgi:hypothetical protein